MNDRPKRIGIILAAGIGARLKKSGIKPLIPVDNIGLLLRTIHSHEIAGCETIVIVLGWLAKEIKNDIVSKYSGRVHLQFVENSKFHLSNGISVLCARPYVKEDFLLTMADHILDEGIMKLVNTHISQKDGATLCVDYKLDTIFDMEDATKVFAENQAIKFIGKKITDYNCIDTGVFIGTDSLMDAIERVYQEKGDASLSEGVQVLADAGKMRAIDIGGCYWQDVDTPEMLSHAEKLLCARTHNRKIR